MNRAAVWHEATEEFCFAEKKDTFVIRLRTAAGDMASVKLCYRDKYIPVERKDTRQEIEMECVACDGTRDYYEVRVSMHVLCMRYFFKLTDQEGETLYYSNERFFTGEPENVDAMFDCPQDLREELLFDTPDWAAGKVTYQIFVDRFASDKEVNEVEWYKQKLEYHDKFHGNLRGILQKLPYLKELGVEVLYLTPIFQAETSHKYDTVDYYRIDPEFGTKEDLQELVKAAHEAGMYVILDGVFNHTSVRFFAFQDLLQNQEQSAYRDWYFPEEFPVTLQGQPKYKCFGYHGGMPKLNCANPEVRAYIQKVAVYWIQEADIDGWRLDVADEIGHTFWQEFRKVVRAVKPQALIIGEIWHYAGNFLQSDQWDTVMNYPFYQAVLEFAAKKSLTPSDFAGMLDSLRGRLHTKVHPLLWNLIDSHDTPRFLWEAGEQKEALKIAAALQLLSPGMPMIYYGDELGLSGGRDPECRRGMLWDENRQDKELLSWYQKLIALRKENPAITHGERKWITTDDQTGLLVWQMTSPSAPTVTIAINNGPKPVKVTELKRKSNLLTNTVNTGTLAPAEVFATIL